MDTEIKHGPEWLEPACEKVYLEKLKEIVLDEDKIFTVYLTANELNINTKQARELLKKFAETNELACTYILTGNLKECDSRGVIMAKGDELQTKKTLFKHVDSELLCSVQKCKKIDFNQVCTVDCPNKTDDTALPGLVISKNCGIRNIKHRKLPSPVKSAPSSEKRALTASNSSEKQIETNKVPKPVNTIANFFNNAPKNSAPKQKTTINKPKGGLSGFLIKNANSNKQQPNEKEPLIEKQPEIVEEMFKENIDVEMKEEEPIVEPTKSSQKAKSTKKRSRTDNDAMPNKKRKRIVQRCDSDSDDMFENDEKNDPEDIIESDNESKPQNIPVKSLEVKNKRRKAVDRTYEDEEGFLITKTEYIYETASEEENEEPPMVEPKKIEAPKRETSPKGKKVTKKPTTGKQGTLLGFFNKK